MNKIYGYISIFLALFIIANAAYATETPSEQTFNLEKAINNSKKTTSILSQKNITAKDLNEGINLLEIYLQDAKDCISDSNAKLDEIEAKVKKYFGKTEDKVVTVDLKYLEENKKKLISRAADCRLFTIKTKENIEKFRDYQLRIKKEVAFTRGDNLYARLMSFSDDWKKLELPPKNKLTLAELLKVRVVLFVLTLLFLANIFTYLSSRLMRKKFRKNRVTFIINVTLVFVSLIFLVLYHITPLFFKVNLYNHLVHELYLLLSFTFFSFYIARILFRFRRLPKIDQYFNFKQGTTYYSTMLFLGIYCFQKIVIVLLNLWQSPEDIIYTFQDLILYLSLISLLLVIEYYIYKNKYKIDRYVRSSLINQYIISLVVLIIAFDWVGYNVLAINIAYIIYSLLFVALLAHVFYSMIDHAYHALNFNDNYKQFLKNQFGFNKEPPYLEISLINLVAKLSFLIFIAYLFAYLIGEVSYFIDKILAHFLEGIHIAGLIIVPYQWLIAITAFCLLSLTARKISTQISQKQHIDADSDNDEKQVAFASIALYLGVTASIIISLLIAGFNFTSLTIIAGALSVGIGLGLQPIVNNFVSGIILLIEKPIKPGDRIQIDDIEGFVKKIRVRSTQIMTPAKEDIIIPNSDFITHQVKNYMFQDRTWRIKTCVGIAYGSDVDLVTQLMKEVALSHPGILKRPPNDPSVFFREFGDSALLFEMWCLIRDVNTKYRVASDLNFAINKVFKENNICIAFPQQDVHLKFDKNTGLLFNKEPTSK